MLQDLYTPQHVADLAWSAPKWKELTHLLDQLGCRGVLDNGASSASMGSPLSSRSTSLSSIGCSPPHPPRLVLLSGPPGCGKLSALTTYLTDVAAPVSEEGLPYRLRVFHTCEHTAEELSELLSSFMLQCRAAGQAPPGVTGADSQGNDRALYTRGQRSATIIKFYGEAVHHRMMRLIASFALQYQGLVEQTFGSSSADGAAESALAVLLRRHFIFLVHTSHDTHSIKHDRHSTFPSALLENPAVVIFNCTRLTSLSIQRRLWSVLQQELARRCGRTAAMPSSAGVLSGVPGAGARRTMNKADKERERREKLKIHSQLIREEVFHSLVEGCAGDMRHALNQLQWTLLLPPDQQLCGPEAAGHVRRSPQQAAAERLWERLQCREGGIFCPVAPCGATPTAGVGRETTVSSLVVPAASHWELEEEEDEEQKTLEMERRRSISATLHTPRDLVALGRPSEADTQDSVVTDPTPRLTALATGPAAQLVFPPPPHLPLLSQGEEDTAGGVPAADCIGRSAPSQHTHQEADIIDVDEESTDDDEHCSNTTRHRVSLAASSPSSRASFSSHTTMRDAAPSPPTRDTSATSVSPSVAPWTDSSGRTVARRDRKRSRSVLDILHSRTPASLPPGPPLSAPSNGMVVGRRNRGSMRLGPRRMHADTDVKPPIPAPVPAVPASAAAPPLPAPAVVLPPSSRDETADLFHSAARLLTQKYTLTEVVTRLNVPSRKLLDYLCNNMHSYFEPHQMQAYAQCAQAGSDADTLRSAVEWRESSGRRTGANSVQSRTNDDDSEMGGSMGWHLSQLSLVIMNMSYRVFHPHVHIPRHFVPQLPPPFEHQAYPRVRHFLAPPFGLSATTPDTVGVAGWRLTAGDGGGGLFADVASLPQWTEEEWRRSFQLRLREEGRRRGAGGGLGSVPATVVDVVRESLPAPSDRCGALAAVLTEYLPYAQLIVLQPPPEHWALLQQRLAAVAGGVDVAPGDSPPHTPVPQQVEEKSRAAAHPGVATALLASTAPLVSKRTTFTLGGGPRPAGGPQRTIFTMSQVGGGATRPTPPAGCAAAFPVTPLQLAVLRLSKAFATAPLRGQRFTETAGLTLAEEDGRGALPRNPDNVEIEEDFSDDCGKHMAAWIVMQNFFNYPTTTRRKSKWMWKMEDDEDTLSFLMALNSLGEHAARVPCPSIRLFFFRLFVSHCLGSNLKFTPRYAVKRGGGEKLKEKESLFRTFSQLISSSFIGGPRMPQYSDPKSPAPSQQQNSGTSVPTPAHTPPPALHQQKPQRGPKTIDPSAPRKPEEEDFDAEASGTQVPPPPQPPMPPSINVLILVTGSVAAIKLGLLLDQFEGERCSIRIAVTKSAYYFIHRAQASKNPIPFQSIVTDDDEWRQWEVVSDAVVHIELRRWADVVLVAPLDANSLAKIAGGLCDNLVTCVMRAWEVKQKPVIICPAMNTAMWTHPITKQQIETLQNWYGVPGHTTPLEDSNFCTGPAQSPVTSPASALPETLNDSMFQVVWPVRKRLACGDIGIGGMASVEAIAGVIRHTMNLIREQKLAEIIPV
eukprot:gene5899-4215_t